MLLGRIGAPRLKMATAIVTRRELARLLANRRYCNHYYAPSFRGFRHKANTLERNSFQDQFPRAPSLLSFHHPRAKLPLSRKPSRRLSIFPRPQSRASPPPNLARSSSPSATTRRNSCDGAPQLAQGAALRFVVYRELGLFVPWHPAHPREVVGLARGFTQSHRALGRSLSAGRNQWAGVRCESDARK
jgi:hypothetical protein